MSQHAVEMGVSIDKARGQHMAGGIDNGVVRVITSQIGMGCDGVDKVVDHP